MQHHRGQASVSQTMLHNAQAPRAMQHQRGQASVSQTMLHNAQAPRAMQHQRGQASMSQTSRQNTQNPKQCSTKGVKLQCPKPVFITPKWWLHGSRKCTRHGCLVVGSAVACWFLEVPSRVVVVVAWSRYAVGSLNGLITVPITILRALKGFASECTSYSSFGSASQGLAS